MPHLIMCQDSGLPLSNPAPGVTWGMNARPAWHFSVGCSSQAGPGLQSAVRRISANGFPFVLMHFKPLREIAGGYLTAGQGLALP